MNKRQFLTYILAGGVGFSTAKVALPVNKESTFTTIAGSKDFLRQVVIGDEELLTRAFLVDCYKDIALAKGLWLISFEAGDLTKPTNNIRFEISKKHSQDVLLCHKEKSSGKSKALFGHPVIWDTELTTITAYSPLKD